MLKLPLKTIRICIIIHKQCHLFPIFPTKHKCCQSNKANAAQENSCWNATPTRQLVCVSIYLINCIELSVLLFASNEVILLLCPIWKYNVGVFIHCILPKLRKKLEDLHNTIFQNPFPCISNGFDWKVLQKYPLQRSCSSTLQMGIIQKLKKVYVQNLVNCTVSMGTAFHISTLHPAFSVTTIE